MDSIPNHHHHQYQQGGYDKNMTNSTNLYSVWNNFFLSAGIPPPVANEYAVTFSQHRIQIDMLKEITKEILLDMGIKAMGDIIAILRHAKQLCTQDELKGGGGTKANPACVNNLMNQATATATTATTTHQPAVSAAAPAPTTGRVSQRTSISLARLSGPTIMSSVGGKIQSRLSLSSGALRASSLGSHDPASGLSSSLVSKPISMTTIRQQSRAAAATMANQRPVPEKTLTVRYSSAAALEKMNRSKERLEAGQSHLGSIKSRLGLGTTSNHHGKDLQGTLRNGHHTGTRPVKYFTHHHNNNNNNNNHHHHHHQNKQQNRRDDTTRQTSSNGRLRSTVFNRLGEGPR